LASRRKADADNPEWTRADFAKAKAPEDVLPADVLSKFGKHRGQQKAPKKVAGIDPPESYRRYSL